MNRLRLWLKRFGMLLAPAMLLGFSMPALAANQSKASTYTKDTATETQIERNVRHELIMLPYFTVFDNLEFQVQNEHTVILSGQVVWASLKDDAENAVKRIKGVDEVINNIEILPASPFDNAIRRREFYAIYSQVGFDRYAIQAVPPIHIIVKDGNVTLVGVVDDQYDKNLVGLAANTVPNVFHVTNDLSVAH
jgi:hyperosmotically inducible protein